MLSKKNIKNIYPLSPMQEGMFFHSLYDSGSPVYFQQMSYAIHGKLDLHVFEQSWNELLRRHDIFRTVFVFKDVPRPLQVVLKERKIEFNFEELRGMDMDRIEMYLGQYKLSDRKRTFNPGKDVLMRIGLFQTDQDSFVMIWSFHHIIMDGWCIKVVHDEFFGIYTALLAGKKPDLKETVSYSQYIKWLEKQDRDAAAVFWSGYLSDYEHRVSVGYRRGNPKENILEKVEFGLAEDLTRKAYQYAQKHNITLNTLIQTVWGVLLMKYNDVTDAVFGSVASVRPPVISGIEHAVGLYINTIPVRIRGEETEKFNELLRRVQAEAAFVGKHNFYGLAEIQASCALHGELMDHIIVFENYPLHNRTVTPVDGLAIDLTGEFEQTNYPLELTVFPGEALGFRVCFDAGVYDRWQMEQLQGHLETILRSVTADEDIRLEDIDILTGHEKERVLLSFNNTGFSLPEAKTVIELFEEECLKRPRDTAIVSGDSAISYEELNERSNVVAHFLRSACGVQPDDLIGLMTGRY